MNQPTTPNTEFLPLPEHAYVLADRAQRPITTSIAPMFDSGRLAPGADDFIELMRAWRFADVGPKAERAFNAVVAHINAYCAGRNAQPEQPASPTLAGSVDGFDLGLASIEAYDPQSFIDGAKWAQKRLLEPSPTAQAVPEDWREFLLYAQHKLNSARIWGGMGWKYNPLHQFHYKPVLDKINLLLAQSDTDQVAKNKQEGK